MFEKTKIPQITIDKFNRVSQQAGLLLMSAAAAMLLVEVPENRNHSNAVVPEQPVFAVAHSGGGHDEVRRERDEVHPHHLSYSVSQRTPARSRGV